MMALLAGETVWVVALISLALALGVVTAGLGWVWDVQRGRLPDATRFYDLKTKVELAKNELAQVEDRRRQLDQQMQDRDRLVAEVLALQRRRDELKTEVEGLASAELQIADMKRQAADAVAAFAAATSALEDARTARADAERALQGAEHRLIAVQREIEAGDDRAEAAAARQDELRSESSVLEAQISTLRQAVAELETERARVDLIRQEIATLEARKLETQHQLASLSERLELLAPQIADHTRSLDRLRDDQATLAAAVANLGRERERLEDARSETAALQARQAALQVEIDAIAAARNGGGAGGAADGAALTDLRKVPVCLEAAWSTGYGAEPEDEALHRVTDYLRRLDLHYDRRTLLAFHTALKINDASQLTVLAGVSGTGKSLLPRRYAEAMGIRFLQIAVEPRWDSPQDLLGFYNYIEKGYKATDLARALLHMDPHGTAELGVEPVHDQMLLVLLDEMNLARVEYYFSEFLSRLEMRPTYGPALDRAGLVAASLPIDVPGRPQGPIRLFPSHNVLFAGTMNDDESTQSLSDKVMDRSNVLQFPAPNRVRQPAGGSGLPPNAQHRSFKQWRTWIRRADSLDGGERDKAVKIISELARILEQMGRPFGHRLSDAILAYAVNYPRAKGTDITVPMVDQVEMRILPKLRGLPLEDRRPFDELRDLMREELGDRGLADCFAALIEQQGDGGGQFNWRGYKRDGA